MAGCRLFVFGMMFFVLMQSCSHPKKIYTSECATDTRFKQVKFSDLIDSVEYYDNQYVEVSGKYVEGKHVSALISNKSFSGHADSQSFWVNFTQDCPLYLISGHYGLFESEDGGYNNIGNHLMTIHGRVQLTKNGAFKSYRATINEISYLELN